MAYAASEFASVAYAEPTAPVVAEGASSLPVTAYIGPVGTSTLPLSALFAPVSASSLGVIADIVPIGYSSLPVPISVGPVGVSSLGISAVVAPLSVSSVGVSVSIGPAGVAGLPISALVGPCGAAILSLSADIHPADFATGAVTGAETRLDPAPPPGYGPDLAAIWRVVITINGEDVTDQAFGVVFVEFRRGAARIAEFNLLPPPGQQLTLPAWVGKVVTIDYAMMEANGSAIYPQRIFTGVVDAPDFSPINRSIRLTCSDDLQGVCGAMSDAQIDAMVGGRWSPVIFDAAKSHGWQRVQDRISTLAASVDLDPWRSPRVTPWISGAPDFNHDVDAFEDESVVPGFASRSGLINRVEIEFTYRYPRLNSAGYPAVYDLLGDFDARGPWPDNQYGFVGFLRSQNAFLSKSAVRSAMSSSGTVVSITFTDVPPSGDYDGLSWAYNPDLCMGFIAVAKLDYGKLVDEVHKITVEAKEAVRQAGAKMRRTSSALEAVFQDLETWESRAWIAASNTNTAMQPAEEVAVAAGFVTRQDATPTPETNRAAANEAIQTLVDMAKVSIKASHRQNRVRYTVPLNPVLDSNKVARVVSDTVAAKGGIERGRHVMDLDTGRAITELELAISSIAGVGVEHPETETAPPSADPADQEPISDTATVTYNYGREEDSRLSIVFPAVSEAERSNKLAEIITVFDAGLVEDEFTITT